MKSILTNGTYFISGIDTDCGKSYATGLLARMLSDGGRSVITQKFVQTGCTDQSEDIELHRQLMGIEMQPEDLDRTTCPLIYHHPASPHLAAALDGSRVDESAIARSTDILRGRYDIVLLEGAGGLMVPISPITPDEPENLTIDYITRHDLPLLFVTSAKLGSLNHTLLSLEVCHHRGVRLAAVLWNSHPAGDPLIAADTRKSVLQYLSKYYPRAVVIDIPCTEK